jgi:hypothetical protein
MLGDEGYPNAVFGLALEEFEVRPDEGYPLTARALKAVEAASSFFLILPFEVLLPEDRVLLGGLAFCPDLAAPRFVIFEPLFRDIPFVVDRGRADGDLARPNDSLRILESGLKPIDSVFFLRRTCFPARGCTEILLPVGRTASCPLERLIFFRPLRDSPLRAT